MAEWVFEYAILGPDGLYCRISKELEETRAALVEAHRQQAEEKLKVCQKTNFVFPRELGHFVLYSYF
jgi:hypothetical protein